MAMARLIDADVLIEDLELLAKHEESFRQSIILGVVHTIKTQNTVDAVPVSELEKLRDYLYAEDLIFMRGLAKLNKLITKHGRTETGKTPDKNTKP